MIESRMEYIPFIFPNYPAESIVKSLDLPSVPRIPIVANEAIENGDIPASYVSLPEGRSNL